jgi:transmembrane sensor
MTMRAIAAAIGILTLAGSIAWWALQIRDDSMRAALDGASVPSPQSAVNPSRYFTAIGERSTVTLPDGSVMVLNTLSEAEVTYQQNERRVRLIQGQALFTVAHDQAAPFRVYAADRVITAVGTVFDVYLKGASVQVAMIEGTVRVSTAQPALHERKDETTETLSAGEALTASPDRPVIVKLANVQRVASWRAGLLTFDETRLADAVEEINRYTTNPISLSDPKAGNYRVTGTFRTGEPERFARTMTQLFPLELEKTPQGRSLLRSKQ